MSPVALAALTAVASATGPLDLGERKAERWDVFRERMERGHLWLPPAYDYAAAVKFLIDTKNRDYHA